MEKIDDVVVVRDVEDVVNYDSDGSFQEEKSGKEKNSHAERSDFDDFHQGYNGAYCHNVIDEPLALK